MEPAILRKEQIVEVPKMEYVDLVREIPRWELNSAPLGRFVSNSKLQSPTVDDRSPALP